MTYYELGAYSRKRAARCANGSLTMLVLSSRH
jgi:hypothetical protein